MRSKFYKLLLLLFFPAIASAILPPAWQGVAELKAILEAPELPQFLDSAEIVEGISKVEKGWMIKTSRSQIFVEVLLKPQKMPGPEKFELQFKKLPIEAR